MGPGNIHPVGCEVVHDLGKRGGAAPRVHPVRKVGPKKGLYRAVVVLVVPGWVLVLVVPRVGSGIMIA